MIFNFINETKNNNIKYIDLKDNKTHEYYLQSYKDYKKHYEKIKNEYCGEIAIDANTDKLVGYVFIKTNSGEEGFISPLWVDKKYRGLGIGRKLLDDAIKKYDAIDLVVNKNNKLAFNMYKRHGFVIIGNGNGSNEYWMKLKSKLDKDDKIINESNIMLYETKRSELPDSAFGIPEDRKFELDTEKHVRSAIRLFGHAEESKKKDLAKRIKIAADKYGVEIKPTTQVYKYLNESYITESASRDLDAVIEFNKKLNNMEYIIVTKNKKIITKIKAKDFDNYETLNPTEFIKYNGGICWDYVMYEAYCFSKYFRNIKYKTFFVCNYNKKSNPTHTFLLFYLNNKCYWFESSWKSHIGIYKFNSESCALSYITKALYDYLTKDQLPVYEIFVREYDALDDNLINISGYEYMNYMDKLDDYTFTKTSICEPEYVYDAKKSFYHESYINENKKYEDIYDAIINGLIKYDQDPKVGKKDEKLFKNTGKSSDDDFGNKLCICNLKGDYYKICQKLNKELKPLGAKLSPDNYGTAFVHLNEQTQTERFYEVLKKKLEEDNNDEYINESNNKSHFYFYHMVPKGTNMKNGITSLRYQYDNNQIDIANKGADKYRDRLVNGWGIYPNRNPEDLSLDEIINGLDKFRGDGGSAQIYFFKYPPYKELGNKMKEILKYKDIYRIDLDDPKVKNIIEYIDWGYYFNNTDNEPMNEEYYRNVTVDQYFSEYTENTNAPLFASIPHIGIKFKNNYIPKNLITKINDSSIINYLNESYINETSMRSKFNDSFEKKGNIKLSSFNKVTMDKQFIDKYKGKFKLLKHVDLNDDKRIAFLDKDNNLVGYISTNKEKDGLIWITALEVSNQYKGYGLGKQLLDYGVKHLGAQALGVAYDNEVAIQMYEKYGFKISKESVDEVKRKENLNYRMYIGSAVNEAEQLEIPDSYNNKPSVLELLDNTDPKRVFLSSDWHFYSLKYKKEKNAVNTRDIVSWCKNNIKDEDVFMYLGDMCFRWASDEDNKKVQEIFKSLPGIKILILGNHDIVAGEEFYLNCGFDYVLNELVWHDYIFSHRPINISNMNYVCNIHGHKH